VHQASATEDIVGAATAACLAAAALLRVVMGADPKPIALNLVTLTAGSDASTASVSGPIDVGDLDLIGGGAVGHAVTYWANAFGVVGAWNVVDGDISELHNTNRCMGMSVQDAGWAEGRPGGKPQYKATSAARNCNASAQTLWFDQLPEDRRRADLILVLANERSVRERVAQLGEPLLIHATTSADWTAELHRHIPGRDDCPACRIPSKTKLTLACSEGPINPADPTSGDAALPFLSAMSGLMLCVALLGLGSRSGLADDGHNHWRLFVDGQIDSPLRASRWGGEHCPHHLPLETRRTRQADEPRRWDHLDD
jgi:hypothetical protein